MNIYIADSYKDYTSFTAKHILHFLEKKQEMKEKLYISVSSEYDTKDIYKAIIENIKNYKINFKNIFIFQQSEYIGLSQNNINSKAYFLRENLLSKIDIVLPILDLITSQLIKIIPIVISGVMPIGENNFHGI